MKDIQLLGKRVLADRSKLLLHYDPAPDWLEYWKPMCGQWEYKDGAIIGTEPRDTAALLFSKEYFKQNVMLSFTVSAVLPATRDLNAVFCAKWDEKTNWLGDSYVCGLNGWYDGKSGLERNAGYGSNLYSTTSLYKYVPGSEVRMTCGAIDGHSFMVVDDVLVSEMIDPQPITGGHVGFSAYCTKLRITDIEIREICYETITQSYDPQF